MPTWHDNALKLLDALDGLDDVRSVNANIELSDDLDLNC